MSVFHHRCPQLFKRIPLQRKKKKVIPIEEFRLNNTFGPVFLKKKVSEKVGGAEGTKLDDDFKEMERKVDVTSRAVMEIMTKTIEYLQPNPASRAKLSMINTMSKIRGQEKGPGYPQAEALLAEAMLKFGRELGDDCNFGPALGEVGEAMRELSEVKDSLDMEVKQNFIDPLQNLHDKDLREIQHHLKKLEGRRLDFDYKKKRQGKIPDEELRQALEKFDESKEIAESSMFNLLEMDIEQVSQLSALVQAQLEYHKQAVQILQQVTVRLEERIRQASSQPRREYQPKPRMSLEFPTGDSTQPNGGLSHTSTPKPAAVLQRLESLSFKSENCTVILRLPSILHVINLTLSHGQRF
ncbi:endophilin-A1 isoform X2 [Felis catus]|uniref:endophilin-A1 isoform X2 n=1 Tax=Felis catus TaxID=9685 RepID=UPI001D19E9B5|nr:endophilin-A1 isoform X2 [Felis catus]